MVDHSCPGADFPSLASPLPDNPFTSTKGHVDRLSYPPSRHFNELAVSLKIFKTAAEGGTEPSSYRRTGRRNGL